MTGLIQRLRRDDDGAAIIELALAAPILAMLVIGIVDLSNAYGRKLSLEQAAQRGIEKIMQTTDDDTVDIAVINEIAASANIPVTQVTMSTKLYCTGRTSSAVTEKAFNEDCDPTNEWESRYIEITARDEFTPMFPMTFGANAEGRYPMRVKVGMRTQ